MGTIKFDISNLMKLCNDVQTFHHEQREEMLKDGVKQLGATYIASAKRNTPVKGNQVREIERKDGKKERIVSSSEHMRRAWAVSTPEKTSDGYRVKVYNTASYATYVDVGHRQQVGRYVPILGRRLVKSFVDGLHITDKAKKAVRRTEKNILNNIVKRYTKRLDK